MSEASVLQDLHVSSRDPQRLCEWCQRPQIRRRSVDDTSRRTSEATAP